MGSGWEPQGAGTGLLVKVPVEQASGEEWRGLDLLASGHHPSSLKVTEPSHLRSESVLSLVTSSVTGHGSQLSISLSSVAYFLRGVVRINGARLRCRPVPRPVRAGS